MKTNWQLSALAGACIGVVGVAGCGELDSVDEESTSACGDGILVASLVTDRGHEYTFCEDGEGGAGAMVSAPIADVTLLEVPSAAGACALDVFLAVAPPDLDAPAALVEACGPAAEGAAERAAAMRAALVAETARPAPRTNYCGGGGQNSFAANECPNAGAGLTNFEWCLSALRTGWVQYTASTQMGAWPSHGRANVAACGGSAHLDYWKRESGGAGWVSLFNQDIAPNDDVSTSWFAGTIDFGYDLDDYRARAESVGAGQFRFGGGYVDCESVFAQCWQ